MIEKLTAQQEVELEEYREYWLNVGLEYGLCDRPKAEVAIRHLYSVSGLNSEINIEWVDSPQQGMDKFSLKELPFFWGNHEAYWVAWALFAEHIGVELPQDLHDKLHATAEVVKTCGWWWGFEDRVILCERPVEQHFNREESRLDNIAGPAIRFADGYSVYVVRGVRVPASVVEDDPETWDIQSILSERNAEISRIMIERLGHVRFMEKTGAKLRNQDDFGKLWDIDGRTDMSICEVINSTAEKDGEHKVYYLIVPRRMRCPLEAVAAGFGLTMEAYKNVSAQS